MMNRSMFCLPRLFAFSVYALFLFVFTWTFSITHAQDPVPIVPAWNVGGSASLGCFTKDEVGTLASDVLFGTNDLPVEEGNTYRLGFTAYGDGDMHVHIGLRNEPYTSFGSQIYTLDATERHYEFDALIGEGLDSASVTAAFQFGGEAGSQITCVSDITLSLVADDPIPVAIEWWDEGDWDDSCFTVDVRGEFVYNNIFGKGDLDVIEGEMYRIRFRAGTGDGTTGKMTAGVGLQGEPYTSFGDGRFTLTSSMEYYEYVATIGTIPEGNGVNLSFQVGGEQGIDVTCVDDITITHIQATIPTNTPIPPTPVNTETPLTDDTCEGASVIEADGTIYEHQFEVYADADWMTFDAVEGETYQVIVEPLTESLADVSAEVYPSCDVAYQVEQSHAFSPNVILNVIARQDGMHKLKLYHADADVYGENVTYRISVTHVPEVRTGAVIILAGREQMDDPLQDNIHHVTNSVYNLFAQNGYVESRIHYVATDATPLDDPNVIVDETATVANVENIILNQVINQVDDQIPLTIYMMSHGTTSGFYLDDVNDQHISPALLDSWLDQLQENLPGLQINIIIDTCYAGSFINNEDGETISGEGRVVITSSTNNELAWASAQGALFSDYFLLGIQQGKSMLESFESTTAALGTGDGMQVPWLDANGDSIHNTSDDDEAASGRFLLPQDGSFGTIWKPYIRSIALEYDKEVGYPKPVTVTAEVLSDPDGLGIEYIEAILYSSSSSSEDVGDRLLTTEDFETVRLELIDNNVYVGVLTVTEAAEQKVGVYVQGNTPDNLDIVLQANPVFDTFYPAPTSIRHTIVLVSTESSISIVLLGMLFITFGVYVQKRRGAVLGMSRGDSYANRTQSNRSRIVVFPSADSAGDSTALTRNDFVCGVVQRRKPNI